MARQSFYKKLKINILCMSAIAKFSFDVRKGTNVQNKFIIAVENSFG